MKRLARPIVITGRGVQGRGLGLRYPTLTLAPDASPQAPEGVYASWVSVEGDSRRYAGATSVGVARTVGAKEPTVETHLLDYHGDLVGKEVRLELAAYLRDMELFSSVEELEETMARDIAEVRRLIY